MSKKSILKLIVILFVGTAFLVSARTSDAAISNTKINNDQVSLTPPFVMVRTDNLPRIVYYSSSAQLVYVQCLDQACANSNRTIVATGTGAVVNGNISAYRISSTDVIKIFYVNNNAGTYTIRLITCTNDVCGASANIYTLPVSGANVTIGFNRFVAVSSNAGLPRLLLSWQDNSTAPATQRLYYFNCNADCGTTGQRQIRTLISATTSWQNVGMATSSGNLALIDYWEVTSSSVANLVFTQCTNASCSAVSGPTTLSTKNVAGLAIGLTSITTTSAGFPAIAYAWKPGAAAPNTQVAICTTINCTGPAPTIYSTLVNDSNPKIILRPSDGTLRIFTTRGLGAASSLRMNQCNTTCSGAWTEVTVEANSADFAGAFIGQDSFPRVVYNTSPGGVAELHMGCDLEGVSSDCAPTFTITPNAPTSATAEQGQVAAYSLTVTSVNGYTCIFPACQINLSAISLPSNTTASFSVPYVNLPTAGSSQVFTMNLTPGYLPATAPGTYNTIRAQGAATVGALTVQSGSVTLNVTTATPKPWIQTTGGNVGSEGSSPNSINFINSSPASNATAMVISNYARINFTSAKNWLIDNFSVYGGINPGVPVGKTYYDYFWEKFGSGKATPVNMADSTICSPPSVFGFTSWGFKSATAEGNMSNCVLTDELKFEAGAGNIDNGVFVFNGDVTWNVADSTTYLGRFKTTVSGNPTVIFITGNLYINKPIETTGNKKFIFIVKNDSDGVGGVDSDDSVQVNPKLDDNFPTGSGKIMASIITNGKVNTFSWLNQRNEERYQKMKVIEEKVKQYKTYSGAYPLSAGQADTSDNCSTSGLAYWYDALNPAGGGTWGGTAITSPCNATQGLRYWLGAGLGAGWPAAIPGYTGIDLNALGCYSGPPLPTNTACIDPTNGAPAGIPGKNSVPGNDGTIARPKRFALRYMTWGTAAYDLFFSLEDDAGHDKYTIIPDPEFHMCGGDYNNPNAGNFLKNQDGNYCYKHNISFSGSVIAQQGFSFGRTSRDDNNSSYGCPNHCPTPAEAFNFDPSFLYYYAKLTGSNPLFAEGKSIIKEERP